MLKKVLDPDGDLNHYKNRIISVTCLFPVNSIKIHVLLVITAYIFYSKNIQKI